MSACAELMEWHAVGDGLPDADTTVLMWIGSEWSFDLCACTCSGALARGDSWAPYLEHTSRIRWLKAAAHRAEL